MLLEQTAKPSSVDQVIENVQDVHVGEAEEPSEEGSTTSDPDSNQGPSIQDENSNEEQSIEYLDEDEDYHEYVDSTKRVKGNLSSVASYDCQAPTGILPGSEFVGKVEDFAQYIIYHVRGERCCGCNMIFPDVVSLSDHCTQVHGNEQDPIRSKLQCDRCFKRMGTNQLLRKHKQAIRSNTLYYCKLCSSVLEDELSFLKHILLVEDHEAVIDTTQLPDKFEETIIKGSVCCGCDIICQDDTDLDKHIVETHFPSTQSARIEVDFECSKCFKQFQKADELLQHQSRTRNRLYCCRIRECTYTTIHKEQILMHISNSHQNSVGKQAKPIKKGIDEMDDDSRFGCCFVRCYNTFESYEELENHAETVHELLRIQHTQDREYTQIICQICQKGFENEQTYERHRTADKNRKHVCRTCGAKYVSKSTLLQHERSNCGKIAQYQCSECDKSFMSLGGFRNHQEVHSSKRSHVCDICGRGFLRKGILKDHMNTVHSKARLFQCTLCSKSFTSRNVFQSHQMTHTKEKPYQCRHCEKRYYKTSDRTMHENQVHLGIRPFKCSYCTASFIRDRERRLHERIHTKAKLYSCELCPEGYNKFAEYKAHRSSEHGLDTLRDLGPVTMAAVHGEQEQTNSQRAECKLEIEIFDIAD